MADTRGAQARVFELRDADQPDAPTATSTIQIHDLPVRVLFDMGATHSFISDACVDRLSLATVEGIPYMIGLPDGSKVRGTREIYGCSVRMGDRDWLVNFLVMPLAHEDVILGIDWMKKHGAVLVIGRRTVTFATEEGHRVIF